MTEEEKENLFKKLKEEKAEKEKNIAEEREAYKELVNETVETSFELLKKASEILGEVKNKIYSEFETVVETKAELYGIKDEQQSHTFTDDKGNSIVIGYRVLDNFDDTVHSGIEKIRNWVYKLAEGDKKGEIKAVIDLLLKKDKNGNLKASRVLELRKLSEKIEDAEFSDGVNIIEKAYKPIRSSNFIEAYYKGENGKRISLPLSITTVE